jgi:hypothetical protein
MSLPGLVRIVDSPFYHSSSRRSIMQPACCAVMLPTAAGRESESGRSLPQSTVAAPLSAHLSFCLVLTRTINRTELSSIGTRISQNKPDISFLHTNQM